LLFGLSYRAKGRIHKFFLTSGINDILVGFPLFLTSLISIDKIVASSRVNLNEAIVVAELDYVSGSGLHKGEQFFTVNASRKPKKTLPLIFSNNLRFE
jgi:hypothetical protein